MLENAELVVRRIEDPLPDGPFDLVFSALAIPPPRRGRKARPHLGVAASLRPGGRFVLGDVVVPERPEDAVTPVRPEYDLPMHRGETASGLASTTSVRYATLPASRSAPTTARDPSPGRKMPLVVASFRVVSPDGIEASNGGRRRNRGVPYLSAARSRSAIARPSSARDRIASLR